MDHVWFIGETCYFVPLGLDTCVGGLVDTWEWGVLQNAHCHQQTGPYQHLRELWPSYSSLLLADKAVVRVRD